VVDTGIENLVVGFQQYLQKMNKNKDKLGRFSAGSGSGGAPSKEAGDIIARLNAERAANPGAKRPKAAKSDFKETKTAGHTKSYNEAASKQENHSTYLKDNGIKETSKNTLSAEEGESISRYTKGFDTDIRNGKLPKDADNLESFIAKSPKFEGEIHRGVIVAANTIPKVGQQIDMGPHSASSWSSEKSSARGFATDSQRIRKLTRESGQPSAAVVFSVKKANGASINHLSEVPGEREVLVSKKSQFKVISITSKHNASIKVDEIHIELEEV
jgi:hypothetical protein